MSEIERDYFKEKIIGLCMIAPCYGYHTVADVTIYVITNTIGFSAATPAAVRSIQRIVDEYFGIIHPNEE